MYLCIFCSWNKFCFSLLDAVGLIIHLLLILEGWAVICDVKLTDRLLFCWLEKKKKLLSKWSRAVCWYEGARTILVSRCLNYWLQLHWEKKSSISMSRKRQNNLSLTKDVGPCVRTSYKSASMLVAWLWIRNNMAAKWLFSLPTYQILQPCQWQYASKFDMICTHLAPDLHVQSYVTSLTPLMLRVFLI